MVDNNCQPRAQYDAVVHSLLGRSFLVWGILTTAATVEDILSHRSGMAP